MDFCCQVNRGLTFNTLTLKASLKSQSRIINPVPEFFRKNFFTFN